MSMTTREMERMLDEVFAKVMPPVYEIRKSPDRRNFGPSIRAALLRGDAPKVIAADIGVSLNTVYAHRRKMSARRAPPVADGAMNKRAVIYQLGQGYGVEDIAVRLKVSADDVRKEIADLRATGRLRSVLKIGQRDTTK